MRIDLHWRRNLRKPRPHVSTEPYFPPWITPLDREPFGKSGRSAQYRSSIAAGLTVTARPPYVVGSDIRPFPINVTFPPTGSHSGFLRGYTKTIGPYDNQLEGRQK